MNIQRVIGAALELQGQLDDIGLPFCFIGGLAVQRWGEPRLTVDADATVLTRFEHDEALVDALLSKFRARRSDGREMALRNRVLLLYAADGTHIDVALGAIPFEARMIERSSRWHYREDVTVRTCSADDLVVHKAFASRDRDWLDIDGILMRQGTKLDTRLIFHELRPLVELKQDNNIIPRLEQKMREYGMGTQS